MLTPAGGVLGIYCSHAYAHSSGFATRSLPRSLKGSDLVLYSIFKSLGIEVKVLPVIETDASYNPEDPQLGIEGIGPGERYYYDWDFDDYGSSGPLEEYLTHGSALNVKYEDLF